MKVMLNNNLKLLIALAVLTVLFFLVRWTKSDKNVKTFKSELFVLDTSAVQTMKLYSKAQNHEEIQFVRNTGVWTITKGGISSSMPANQMSSLLQSVATIKPKRLAARSKDKWEQYQVNDSLGTRLVLEDKSGKSLVDLMIGKFSYKQLPQQPGQFNQQPNISGLTYVRNTADAETYATEGFLSMTFNRDFNSFRDKRIVETTPTNIRSIQFQTPIEGNFSLNKLGNQWTLDGVPADSTKVENYLNGLRYLSGNEIDDNFNASSGINYRLTLAGDNMQSINVTAFPQDTLFKIQSNLNPNTTFSSAANGVFDRLFKGKGTFLE